MERELKQLPTHRLGYAIHMEKRDLLEQRGVDPKKMLKMASANPPPINVQNNPRQIIPLLDQLRQGACAGHAGARMMIICFFLMTGRVLAFSRAAAYYLAQKHDGIRGDNGSTLDGIQWVLTQHGLCLEREWMYPTNYDPTEPRPIPNYGFKLVASKPTSDPGEVRAWLDIGLPVQDGITWNAEVAQSIVTNYTGSRPEGGHSTTLWLKNGENYLRDNSWGAWDGDGCNENTPKALDQQVRFGGNTHILYAPEQMIYPELAPVTLPE